MVTGFRKKGTRRWPEKKTVLRRRHGTPRAEHAPSGWYLRSAFAGAPSERITGATKGGRRVEGTRVSAVAPGWTGIQAGLRRICET